MVWSSVPCQLIRYIHAIHLMHVGYHTVVARAVVPAQNWFDGEKNTHCADSLIRVNRKHPASRITHNAARDKEAHPFYDVNTYGALYGKL